MNIEITKGQLASLLMFTSKDDNRKPLHNVCIRWLRDKFVACATDGRRILIVNLTTQDEVPHTDVQYALCGVQLGVLQKMMGVNAVATIAIEPGKDAARAICSKMSLPSIDIPVVSDFPNVECVVPSITPTPSAEVYLNAQYLEEVCAAANKMHGNKFKSQTVHIGITDMLSPVRIDIGNDGGSYAYIMPCKAS